jgi:anti-anti-sigma factor
MSVRRREIGGVVVLDVVGEYYGGRETAILDRVLSEEVQAPIACLLVNLSECVGMNSTAFGVLFRAHHACRARGIRTKFCGAAGRMRALIQVLQAGVLLDHHGTEEEALAAFAERATA